MDSGKHDLIYKKLAKKLILEIKDQLDNGRVVLAIDGPCTSGKSTLARYIGGIFDSNIIPMDHFFLPFSRKTKERLAEVGGNIDYERFYKEVTLKIEENKTISYQPYNCQTDKMEEKITLIKKPLTIIEGVYSLREEFRSAYNIIVFQEVAAQEQVKRLTIRSNNMLERFINEWVPMEEKYFKKFNIKESSDFIIKT